MPLPRIDLGEIAVAGGGTLAGALADLDRLYREIDLRTEALASRLELPCGAGCGACCHEAVFVTPLEWWAMVAYLQQSEAWELLARAVERASRIYREQRTVIDGFLVPPPTGHHDHWGSARELHFQCPFLEAERCTIYPARGMVARLFGASFQRPGVVFGCRLVEQHLAGQEVRLLNARAWTTRLADLPLTQGRQVIPYYIVRTYAAQV